MKHELNFNCESVQGELDSQNEGVKKAKYNAGDRIYQEDCIINFRDEVLGTSSDSENDNCITPIEKPGFSVFKNGLYDKAVCASAGSMDTLKRILEGDEYMKKASDNKEPCSLCGDTDAPCPEFGTHIEKWITCYQCLKWYHQISYICIHLKQLVIVRDYTFVNVVPLSLTCNLSFNFI